MVQNKELAEAIKKDKYLQEGETFKECTDRIAGTLSDSSEHFRKLQSILYSERFLPAGRILTAIGSIQETTPYNCYVSSIIPDSMKGIMGALSESLQTLRLGGGIGYDFSTLRPFGDRITSINSTSCGPVGNSEINNRGFMDLFDSGCAVIRSAGHRRGAQMGVLRVDHPDIRHFIRAKREAGRLLNFNVSVGITDEFMRCVKSGESFQLKFEGKNYERINARNLWEEIMRSTWDYAEPGVLFLDTINNKNNLWYCETITATNPCGEQPLPPYGACLLGSFNLTQYVTSDLYFDYNRFRQDIPEIVRMMDNVVDVATYPLPQQEKEAKTKRRMGLGVSGLASACELMRLRYGTDEMLRMTETILTCLRDTAYMASCSLALEKGVFPKYDKELYMKSNFIQTLPKEVKETINATGIRNSHLLSIAPTGTISLSAGNISSGIEPPYRNNYTRKVIRGDGKISEFYVTDWVTEHYGIEPVTADECSCQDHVKVLNLASKLVDSSVSKTCNVGDKVTFDEFKNIYMQAYEGGASGCTTFREAGFREGILKEAESVEDGAACYIDPETGMKTCE